MKQCSLCKETKDLTNFGVKKRDGLYNSWCKECVKQRTLRYKRTPKGLNQQIYQFQLVSSIRRKHPAPTYTKEWLLKWLVTQPNFQKLLNEWVISNYSKNKIPSVDRLDDNLPYTKTNIQLMSWEENNRKGNTCYQMGKIGRQVIQLDLNGNVIKQWPNTIMPSIEVGCTSGEISRVCRGRRNSCRGYKWKYINE